MRTKITLTKLTLAEVETGVGIQNQLKQIGITEWEALSKENPMVKGIKCKCKSHKDQMAILKEFYLSGLKMRMSDNTIIWVQVNPEISNPMQCFHCFEYGKHVAANCPDMTDIYE